MKKADDQLVQELADQMKNMDPMLVRKMRAVTDEMKINPDMEGQVDDNEDKCEVRNLTCVKFPTRTQCSGIAMGGCMTRIQIMSMIFSPRVVLFLLVGIAGLTVAALFFSYFWYSYYSKKSLQFDEFLNLVLIFSYIRKIFQFQEEQQWKSSQSSRTPKSGRPSQCWTSSSKSCRISRHQWISRGSQS